MSKARRTIGRLAFAILVLGAFGAAGYLYLPELIGGPLVKARASYRRGEWGRAESFARSALKEKPGEVEARVLLARSLSRLKRDGEAIPIYRGLGIEKLSSEDLMLVGTSLTRQGEGDLARDALETSLQLDPNNVEALRAMLAYYRDADALAEALPFAERLRGIRGEETFALVELARLYEELDDPASARAAWEEAFKHDPRLRGASVALEAARLRRASVSLRLGRPDEALAALASDGSKEAAWLVGRAHLQKGAFSEAAAALEKSGGVAARDPLAPEPSPYVGSAKCAECHDAIARSQFSSRHAKTFRLGTDLKNIKLPDKSIPDTHRAGVAHAFHRGADGRVTMETKNGDETYKTLIDFAFGSGDRGLTFVGRDREGYGRELRLSHFGEGDLWDMTIGQNPNPPEPLDLCGRYLSSDGVRRCVGCHVTRPGVGLDRSGPEAADGAIGCERCHGPGGHHVRAVEAEFADLAIARPKEVVGEGIVNLCGECHRPKGMNVDRNTPAVVRFQAATLTWSKCYKESFGKLDCVTCHDPHRNAVSTPAFYESRCLACHSPKNDPAPAAARLGVRSPDARMRRTVCKVNPKNGCVGCHMPVDSRSIPHSPFTDHEIRIDRNGR